MFRVLYRQVKTRNQKIKAVSGSDFASSKCHCSSNLTDFSRLALLFQVFWQHKQPSAVMAQSLEKFLYLIF